MKSDKPGSLLGISRRNFLAWIAAAPPALRAVRLLGGQHTRSRRAVDGESTLGKSAALSAEPTVTYQPQYPLRSDLDAILEWVDPEHDVFPIEKYAARIKSILAVWSRAFLSRDISAVRPYLGSSFAGGSFKDLRETLVRRAPPLEIRTREYGGKTHLSADRFLAELADWMQSRGSLTVAEFEVGEAAVLQESPLIVRTTVSFRLAGTAGSSGRVQRGGLWQMEWAEAGAGFIVQTWAPVKETLSLAPEPVFIEITESALGGVRSYREQLLPSITAWRTRLDSALGLDVYSNTGISAGDFNGDGLDDVYICQPAGLPNRLYRNRGDGTFEDVTEAAGVALLDDTSCALFADIENTGRQDLVVVTATSPLLFLNQGNGTFRLKPDAFHFAEAPQGTFTCAAFGDYDRDGRLDIYFCLYSYYRGLDQYQYPSPYYNAKNGPPNYLLHNEGNWTFRDVTAETGMNQNNDHYSFDCHWCDFDGDGWLDLYVVNDFGAKNLYHNKGKGTFSDIAGSAGVLDIGPGMSGCWFDANNDGRMDLYVSDMWEAAGTRLTAQPDFMPHAPEAVRALYRRHARGNSLFLSEGALRFGDVTAQAGAERAGWSWSGFAWDFDSDGHEDIYVCTGMVSGPDPNDLDSFFWRRVVAQSPVTPRPWRPYELGWNAINELIRSDGTWAGYEPNAFYCNHGYGTFSEVAGAVGLDFLDDSRAFALADFDHDGRQELFLKSRTSPQIRLLRNAAASPDRSIAVRLEGTRSNRDAIGASVRLKTSLGEQVKLVECGSGFASQHSRELFFGLGESTGPVEATVSWPSGLTQRFTNLPRGCRISIQEGKPEFSTRPFASPPHSWLGNRPNVPPQPLPSQSETWLTAPLAAPDFILSDQHGRPVQLAKARGTPLLLFLWSIESEDSRAMLVDFQKTLARHFSSPQLSLVALSLDRLPAANHVTPFAHRNSFSFPVAIATDEIGGVYNLLYRYLFDRHRNLPLPVVFLLDRNGMIVKVNQGLWEAKAVLGSAVDIPDTAAARRRRALPFEGKAYGVDFSRDYLTPAIALAQHGYDQAAVSAFHQAIGQQPDSWLAQYSLGTLFLRNHQWSDARQHLMRALQLNPNYGLCLTNLGVLAAQQGEYQEAEAYFNRALGLNPLDSLALQNLAEVYRVERRWSDAERILARAMRADPASATLCYILGMVYADQGDKDRAGQYLEQAVKLQPDYPQALNNLGVIEMLKGDPAAARQDFERCLRVAPAFDQPYVNLARMDALAGKREEAVALLRELLARQPGHAEARELLRELQH
jgi:Flp pilus assembly protein TadD/peroxiredoxin